MKKILPYLLLIALMNGLPVAEAQTKKQRATAATDAATVSARKISVAYTDGLKAYYTANTSQAINIFNGILLDNPSHDPSHYMLAKIAIDKRYYTIALDHLQKASKLDKNNIWYKVEMAQLLVESEEYAQAAKLWEQICKEKTNNEYYLFSLAMCYYYMQKYDKFIGIYNKVEQLMGYHPEITEAKVAAWLAMDKVKEAANEYDQLIKIFPNNAEYYLNAASIYSSNGMMDKAMPYFQKAAQLNPDQPDRLQYLFSYAMDNNDRASALDNLTALFKSDKVQWEEKRDMLGSYLTRFADAQSAKDAETLIGYELARPNPSADVYAIMGSVCLKQNKMKESADWFEQAFIKEPSLFASFFQPYVKALTAINEWNRLLPFEDEILELYPQNANAYRLLGSAYMLVKDYDKAIDRLKKALSFAYDKTDLHDICVLLEESCRQIGDEASAESYARKAASYRN